jgi:hypothetical protein
MSVIKHWRDEEYTDLIESLVYASKDANIAYYLSIMSYQASEEQSNRRGFRLIATVMTLNDDTYGEHISSHSLSEFHDTPNIPFLLAQMTAMSVKMSEGYIIEDLHLDWIHDSMAVKDVMHKERIDLFTASYETVWSQFEAMHGMFSDDDFIDETIGEPERPTLKLVVNNDA